MIPLPSWLTVKPLLVLVGVLLIALVAQTVNANLAHAARQVAQANTKIAQAATVAAITERDAYKLAVTNAEDAAGGWEAVAEERLDLLNECQVERDRIDADTYAAVAKAQADAAKAKRGLTEWKAKYDAANREPTCAAARANLDASCPAEDY